MGVAQDTGCDQDTGGQESWGVIVIRTVLGE